LPAHVLSLIALAIACVSRCSKKMQGSWLKSYVFTAMISLYFNVLVLIAQSFMKSSRSPTRSRLMARSRPSPSHSASTLHHPHHLGGQEFRPTYIDRPQPLS